MKGKRVAVVLILLLLLSVSSRPSFAGLTQPNEQKDAVPAGQIEPSTPLAGDVTSEGLEAMNATAWHAAGILGNGVKVAIIDHGFLGYNALIGSELPYAVTAKNFVDGESDLQVDGGARQGTACAEIIHDIAPQAALSLVKIATPGDLEEAVSWLISQDVDIISTSLGWYNLTPGDGSGQLAELVQLARANGILWITAAGDSRLMHWGGPFNDPDGDSYHEFSAGSEVNDFIKNDGSAFTIPAGTPIRGYLRWDDWTEVEQDYDLRLMRFDVIQGWKLVTSSSNRQSGLPGQTPTETIEINAPLTARYGFVISRYDSTRPVNLEFFVEGPGLIRTQVSARSLLNLADAAEAVTVSAVNVNSPFSQVASSAEGPTNGPGGALEGGLIKPDVAGYANVSTASFGEGAFQGTVAAAPHTAGAAALLKSINLSFSPSQVEAYLLDMASDLGEPGVDTIYGYGRLFLVDPLAFTTPPDIHSLPDQYVPTNTSLVGAIDLWQYTIDNHTTYESLTFSIVNLPAAAAGVSIREYRYIDIHPVTDWTGETLVTVRVTNPYGLADSDSFEVFVYSYKFWNGDASSDWSTPENWTPSGVPGLLDQVIIPARSNQPVLSEPAAVNELAIFPGAVLDLGAYKLTVEGTVSNQGELRQQILAVTGETTPILILTNQAGDQVTYAGLALTLPPADGRFLPLATAVQITAAISGEQTCDGRFTGVRRCYEIHSDQPLTADLKFYFSPTEGGGIDPAMLAAYLQMEDTWVEQVVTYQSGSENQALYLQAFGLTELGSFALDAKGRTGILLLPLVFK